MTFFIFGLRRVRTGILAFFLLGAFASTAWADPAIWRVEGGPEPVWLLGTFHFLPPDAEWRTSAVESAFNQADVLVVEARLDDAAIAESQKIVRQKAFLKGGKRLRDYLTPEDQTAYEKVGNRLGLYPTVLDHYRPWYASIRISVALYLEQGFQPDSGVDTVLQKRAETVGKRVAQFETASEQLNFLADMPEHMQVAMLKATLQEAEELPEQIDTLLSAWQSGDTKAMDALLNESLRTFPAVYDRMLVQRNKNWLPRIENMIADDKSYFIAVGAAHLVGKDSVIALLRAKGYEVTEQ